MKLLKSTARRWLFGALVSLAATSSVSAQTITGITNNTRIGAYFGKVGDLITISGSGFTSVVELRFNGTPAINWRATQDNIIQGYVPYGATSGYVTVRKSGGPYVFSSQVFTVIGAGPFIANFSPVSGGEGDEITLNGANFTGLQAVKFGNLAASVTSFLENQLKAHAPAGVMTAPISVITSAGTFVTTSNFYVAPIISGYSPSAGSPGTTVTITGTNFLGTTSVEFGSKAASSYTVDDNFHITATVPLDALTGRLLVRAPGGLFQVISSNFVVTPVIYNVSPLKGRAGTSVTIDGANLSGSTPKVRFNGVEGTLTANGYDQILVTAPESSSGPITVTTTDGTAKSASIFYYPPVINSFTPNNAPPGTNVTIHGESFTNASLVEFNGLSASFSNVNNTTITAIVPQGVTTGPITVTAPGGTTNSGDLFYAPPVINSFSPTMGDAGTNVTIQGSNFQDVTSVKFNGKTAVFTNRSAIELVATAPNGVTTGPISVTGPAGTAVSSQSFVVPTQADVHFLGFFVEPNPVGVGESLTNTIHPANDGPNLASNVTVSVTLGAGMVLKSASATRGSINTNGNPVVFSLGNVSSQDFPKLVLVVQPNQIGQIANVATITSSVQDPDLSNNTAQRTVAVLPSPVLNITSPQANRVRISWPVELTNYALQFAPSPSSGASWDAVATPVGIEGDERVVIESTPERERYYRLKK